MKLIIYLKSMIKIGRGLISFLLAVAVDIVRAAVFMMCWKWFIVPTFHLPTINLALAYGITLMWGLFSNFMQPPLSYNEDERWTLETAARVNFLLNALVIWGCAWWLSRWI